MKFSEYLKNQELNEAKKGKWKAAGFIYDDAFGNPNWFVAVSDGDVMYLEPHNSRILKYNDVKCVTDLAKASKLSSNQKLLDTFKHSLDPSYNLRLSDPEINLERVINNTLAKFSENDNLLYVYVYAKIDREQYPLLVRCNSKGEYRDVVLGLPGKTGSAISNLSYALDRSAESIRDAFDKQYGTGSAAITRFIKDCAIRSKGSNEKFVKYLQEFLTCHFDKSYVLQNVPLYKGSKTLKATKS